MANATTLQFGSTMSVTETLNKASLGTGSNGKVTHDQHNESATYTSSTTPKCKEAAAIEVALSGGAATIDLAAIAGTIANIDGSGDNILAIKFKNRTGNAVMTISEGATNGYALLGTGFTFKLLADQSATFFLDNSSPDIGATDKTIDIAGTGTEVIDVILVTGEGTS